MRIAGGWPIDSTPLRKRQCFRKGSIPSFCCGSDALLYSMSMLGFCRENLGTAFALIWPVSGPRLFCFFFFFLVDALRLVGAYIQAVWKCHTSSSCIIEDGTTSRDMESHCLTGSNTSIVRSMIDYMIAQTKEQMAEYLTRVYLASS